MGNSWATNRDGVEEVRMRFSFPFILLDKYASVKRLPILLALITIGVELDIIIFWFIPGQVSSWHFILPIFGLLLGSSAIVRFWNVPVSPDTVVDTGTTSNNTPTIPPDTVIEFGIPGQKIPPQSPPPSLKNREERITGHLVTGTAVRAFIFPKEGKDSNRCEDKYAI